VRTYRKGFQQAHNRVTVQVCPDVYDRLVSGALTFAAADCQVLQCDGSSAVGEPLVFFSPGTSLVTDDLAPFVLVDITCDAFLPYLGLWPNVCGAGYLGCAAWVLAVAAWVLVAS
jgi:hypothetical protein